MNRTTDARAARILLNLLRLLKQRGFFRVPRAPDARPPLLQSADATSEYRMRVAPPLPVPERAEVGVSMATAGDERRAGVGVVVDDE
jgi:hypothetical protein